MSRNFHNDYLAVGGNLNNLEIFCIDLPKKQLPGQLKMKYRQRLNAPCTQSVS